MGTVLTFRTVTIGEPMRRSEVDGTSEWAQSYVQDWLYARVAQRSVDRNGRGLGRRKEWQLPSGLSGGGTFNPDKIEASCRGKRRASDRTPPSASQLSLGLGTDPFGCLGEGRESRRTTRFCFNQATESTRKAYLSPTHHRCAKPMQKDIRIRYMHTHYGTSVC